MNKKLNSNSSAGAADDSESQPIVTSIEANPVLAEVPMWEHLYGKLVKMDDRFETECYWIKELAVINNGRWEPKEI